VKSGIIMEINRRFLTVLTPNGEFLHVRRQDQLYQVGQEINFSTKELEKKVVPFSMPIKVALTACAFVLVFISIIPVYQANQVYAYMSIDVNPSIELGMNENLKIVELIPYNKDGEKIVNMLSNWKRKDIDEVTLAIMNEINEQGYTKKNHEVVVSTVFVKDQHKDNNKLQKEIKVIEKEIAKENLNVILVEASPKEREKAKEKGITTGIYIGNSNNQMNKDSEKDRVEAVKQEEKTSIEPPPIQQQAIKPSENQEVFIPEDKDRNFKRKDHQPSNEVSDEIEKEVKKREEKVQKREERHQEKEQKREEKIQRKIEQKNVPNQNNQNQGNKDRNHGKENRDNDNRQNQNQQGRPVDGHNKSNQSDRHEDQRKKDKHDRSEQKNR
jgi:Anti-sigma factor N-terminus